MFASTYPSSAGTALAANAARSALSRARSSAAVKGVTRATFARRMPDRNRGGAARPASGSAQAQSHCLTSMIAPARARDRDIRREVAVREARFGTHWLTHQSGAPRASNRSPGRRQGERKREPHRGTVPHACAEARLGGHKGDTVDPMTVRSVLILQVLALSAAGCIHELPPRETPGPVAAPPASLPPAPGLGRIYVDVVDGP